MLTRRLVLAAAAGAALTLMSPNVFADEAANVAIVNDYLVSWNAHEIEKTGAFFTDDVVYYDSSVGTPVIGKAEATAQVVANFMNAAPDLKWEMVGGPIAQGDMVAFQWKFSGTNTGAWADATEASNRPFMFTGATIMSVTDGHIKTQSDYYDSMTLAEELGWLDGDDEEGDDDTTE